jgi:hypothetical protein
MRLMAVLLVVNLCGTLEQEWDKCCLYKTSGDKRSGDERSGDERSGILNVRQRKVRHKTSGRVILVQNVSEIYNKINIFMIFRHLDCYVIYIVSGNIILKKVGSKISRTPIHYLSVQQVSVASERGCLSCCL